MNIVKLTDSVAVCAQIAAAHAPQIAAAGYCVLVNNRPDGEESGQPSTAEIEAAARAAGLEYHYLPITAANFPGEDFARMCRLMSDSSRPLLAFCRSGTRCANLWVASHTGSEREQALHRAQRLGYDLGLAARYAGV
ncbi:MAG: TIGR01244 family phosphatase [Halioglobus sp.]|nr:TIGR01244 family phosphatase [Halioglobus sp.]